MGSLRIDDKKRETAETVADVEVSDDVQAGADDVQVADQDRLFFKESVVAGRGKISFSPWSPIPGFVLKQGIAVARCSYA
jgi:hypothetical protein